MDRRTDPDSLLILIGVALAVAFFCWAAIPR